MSVRLTKNSSLDKDVIFVGKTITMSGINTTTVSADTVSVANTFTTGSGLSTTQVSATNAIVSSGLTVNGAARVGNSGTNIQRLTVVSQAIDLAQVNSAVASVVTVAFTSGAAGIVSSGDYCIPLSDQLAASGIILTPGQTATGDSLTFGYLNVTNVDPAVTAIRFLVLRSV